MKTASPKKGDPGMVKEPRHEYNFEGGVRGKHAAHLAEGGNVVVLDPDVARVFPTSREVNDALRALLPLLTGKRPQRRKKESE